MPIAELIADVPVALRVVVGLIGGVLVLSGARFYYVGLYLAAFAAGAGLVASAVAYVAPMLPVLGEPMPAVVASVLGGAFLAGVTRMAHRLAMLGAGAFTGLVVGAGLVQALSLPVWVTGVGVLAGAVLFPWVYEQLLKVLTPAVGAAFVAWAVGMPDQPAVLGGLWVFGTVVQVVGSRGGAGGRDTEVQDKDEQ